MRDYGLQLSKILVFDLVLKRRPFISWFIVFRRLKGKELEGMSFWELISLEKRLNDSLHSVKKVKKKKEKFFIQKKLKPITESSLTCKVFFVQTQLLLNQVGRSRL